MYNLQTYREEMRYQLEQAYGPSSMRGLPDAYAFRLLTDAQNSIQASLKLDIVRQKTEDIASGTYTYNLPADRIGSDLAVSIVRENSSDGNEPLKHLSNREMREMFNLDSDAKDSGRPKYWSYLNSTRTQIMIRPSPSYSKTDGLIYDYAARPEPLTRIYDAYYTGHSTVTVDAATNGSPTVTLSGDPNADAERLSRIEAGDEIGVISTGSMDGITAAADAAHASRGGVLEWYRISSLATATVTLAENYRGNTISSSTPFISAQVSDLEKRLPGKIRFAIAYIALNTYFEGRDAQQADRMAAKASRILNGFDIEEAEPFDVEYPSAEFFSWMNFKGGNYV